MTGTSEYTPPPPSVPKPPEPEQRATLIPPEDWVPRAGWTTMANRAVKNGYTVRLTYARGRFERDGDLTHGLMLRVFGGTLVPVAAAWWWAKASEDDTDNLRPTRGYDFKGAMIAGTQHKVSSSELSAFLTRPKETT